MLKKEKEINPFLKKESNNITNDNSDLESVKEYKSNIKSQQSNLMKRTKSKAMQEFMKKKLAETREDTGAVMIVGKSTVKNPQYFPLDKKNEYIERPKTSQDRKSVV